MVRRRHWYSGVGPLNDTRDLRSKIGHDPIMVPSVAAVISDADGRLLLQQKGRGEGWSLPAEAVEPGETPHQAIGREVLEETGLTVTGSELLGVFGGKEFRYEYPNGDRVEYLVVLFRCVTTGDPGSGADTETVGLDQARDAFGEIHRESKGAIRPAVMARSTKPLMPEPRHTFM